jgi:non-specific protein-tyrosine kinase
VNKSNGSYGRFAKNKESENAFSLEGKEKAGWVCPTYDQSQQLRLDPQVVVENRCIAILPGSPDIEAYKVLRTKILKLTKEKGWNTIMVTSALPGEGKTLTAINLSLTFAREFNHSVLLVDCDLRKQNVHEVMGANGSKGLVDYLLNDVPMPEIMIWPGIEKFTLISGSRTVHDSAELLASPKMKELFLEMKTRYPDRYIFFDVPPLLSVSDAMTFASLVDGILFVVQAGKTPMEDVERAIEMIPREKFLGFVLNRKKEHLSDYDAKAYYGYPFKAAM